MTIKTQIARQFAAAQGLAGWTATVAVPPMMGVLPLIDGLVGGSGVRMARAAPGRMAALLDAGRVDVALLPTIDIQRVACEVRPLPAACLACDGPTEMVRLFSRVAPASVRQLHVDADARSSATMASILWAESFNCRLEQVRCRADRPMPGRTPDSILVVGDKIPRWEGVGYPWRIDLGAAWKELVEAPFVFSVWTMRVARDVSVKTINRRANELHRLFAAARSRGVRHVEEIARRHGQAFGWTRARANRSMGAKVQYEFTDEHRRAVDLFFRLAEKHDLIDAVRNVTWHAPD